MSFLRTLTFTFTFTCTWTAFAAAQNTASELRESQLRLERIRQEKLELQRELDQLKSRVRDASREAANVKKQRAASASALRELDYQADVIYADVENTTRQLALTHAQLRERNAAMHERLRSVYKMGKLHTVKVLLSAENFGDLLSRYKYLHLITVNDQLMVTEVAHLQKQLEQQELELKQSLAQLESLRQEKQEEVRQLERLEGRQVRTLAQFRERERATSGKLEQLLKDEARIAGVITDLERRRMEEERRGVRTATKASISTRDLGALDWPVEGELVFRFGPETKPNGVVLRYNGIGIAAPAGSIVKAVEAGTVEIAGPLEGYGPSVVVGHGGGYYTLYLRLRTVAVKAGQDITAGQVIGTVGGEATPEGPHLEFQVRTPSASGAPSAVDPLNWLRARAGPR
ncbi:MAG: murein hydrolase activator EnvC family protein [Gemmatimonadota bacterium]